MLSKPLCGLLIACGIFMSCQNENKDLETTSTALATTDENQQLKQVDLGADTSAGPSPVSNRPAPAIDWSKKIIKNATVKLEVKDMKQYSEAVYQKIKKHNAYIAQEDNAYTDYKYESVLTIKVPVAQFEDLVNDLGGQDIKIIERSIRSEDVTGQVLDTKSRLEAKKQMRLKYLEFLKQSKNIEEVLKVQEEINGIQEEIEAAAGRISYLGNQSAYSTIQLTFYQPLTEPAPQANPGFFRKALEAFKGGADAVKVLLLGMISIWPLLLILFGAIYFWRRKSPARVKAG